ncbi:hypothetical protein PCAR4_390023 [Paraburkholderia caribensis]|nr:hypothetical protein PCAR4_390023 [Paraburkholderia caribensis]
MNIIASGEPILMTSVHTAFVATRFIAGGIKNTEGFVQAICVRWRSARKGHSLVPSSGRSHVGSALEAARQ